MLKEARSKKIITTVVAAVLTLQDGTDVVAHYSAEYGDGDGMLIINEFVESVRRQKLLKRGEKLRIVTRNVELI